MDILEVSGLAAGYGDVQILWGVDMKIAEGRATALLGANGAGKTTLLRAVMGLIKPCGGSVRFLGRDVTSLSAHAKARQGLVLVPEGRQLFAGMSVLENLMLGASGSRARPSAKANLARVCDMFPVLADRRAQNAETLSGGEQQMLAIGRGIMAAPVVLMIDELSLGLAPLLVRRLMEVLRTLRDGGLTILLVEQNARAALSVGDYGYILGDGKSAVEGTARQLLRDPQVRAAYLGL